MKPLSEHLREKITGEVSETCHDHFYDEDAALMDVVRTAFDGYLNELRYVISKRDYHSKDAILEMLFRDAKVVYTALESKHRIDNFQPPVKGLDLH